MTTINKRHVKKSKKAYTCDDCNRTIKQGSEYVYLYGMAYKDERPYSLHICARCNRKAEEYGVTGI